MSSSDLLTLLAAAVVVGGALHILSKREVADAHKALTVAGAVVALGTILGKAS